MTNATLENLPGLGELKELNLSLIPVPRKMDFAKGEFPVDAGTRIICEATLDEHSWTVLAHGSGKIKKDSCA